MLHPNGRGPHAADLKRQEPTYRQRNTDAAPTAASREPPVQGPGTASARTHLQTKRHGSRGESARALMLGLQGRDTRRPEGAAARIPPTAVANPSAMSPSLLPRTICDSSTLAHASTNDAFDHRAAISRVVAILLPKESRGSPRWSTHSMTRPGPSDRSARTKDLPGRRGATRRSHPLRSWRGAGPRFLGFPRPALISARVSDPPPSSPRAVLLLAERGGAVGTVRSSCRIGHRPPVRVAGCRSDASRVASVPS